MKIIVSSIAFATLLTTGTITNAQTYLAVDGGGMFQQSATLRQTGLPDTTATFHTGARGDIDLGYNFSACSAAELEAGFMWNSIDKAYGQSLSASGQSADIYSIPLLANFFLKIPTHTPLIPYFGVGGGGNVSIINFKDRTETFNETDIEPAVQGEAGLRYMLCRNASIGVGYKFMATLAQRYNFNSLDDHLSLAGIYIHTVFINFKVNF
jgi:opacity protein-like surface antigen